MTGRSQTSWEAFQSLTTGGITKQERACLNAIHRAGGATCEEIEEVTSLPHQSASARLRGLAVKNQIHDSGEKRRTKSGRRAVVWKITPADKQLKLF